MKRTLLLFAVICCAITAQSQITLTTSDLPVIGNMVVAAVDTTTVVSPGNAGPNQVWDISNLLPMKYDTTIYEIPSGHINSQDYPLANILYNTKNPECEGCTSDYYLMYVKHASDGVKMIGGELNASMFGMTMRMHVHYTNDQNNYVPLPLNYGDHYVQNSTSEMLVAIYYGGVMTDSSKVVYSTELTFDVDAYGTMITPYTSMQVLRLKEVNVQTETSYSWNGTAWEYVSETQDPAVTSYRWYANDYFEVGSVEADSKATGFKFFKEETVVGTANLTVHNSFRIWPNPVGDIANIVGPSTPEKIEVFNIAGSLIMSDSNTSAINLSKVNPGIYFVKVYSGENTEIIKVTR
jgi:hypothetical protein